MVVVGGASLPAPTIPVCHVGVAGNQPQVCTRMSWPRLARHAPATGRSVPKALPRPRGGPRVLAAPQGCLVLGSPCQGSPGLGCCSVKPHRGAFIPERLRSLFAPGAVTFPPATFAPRACSSPCFPPQNLSPPRQPPWGSPSSLQHPALLPQQPSASYSHVRSWTPPAPSWPDPAWKDPAGCLYVDAVRVLSGTGLPRPGIGDRGGTNSPCATPVVPSSTQTRHLPPRMGCSHWISCWPVGRAAALAHVAWLTWHGGADPACSPPTSQLPGDGAGGCPLRLAPAASKELFSSLFARWLSRSCCCCFVIK